MHSKNTDKPMRRTDLRRRLLVVLPDAEEQSEHKLCPNAA